MVVSKERGPVIYPNGDILSDTKSSLYIADMVRYNEKLFILTRDTCSLYEYDTLVGEIRWCGFVKNQLNQIFICMTVCEGKIYFAPYEADVVIIYDIEEGKFDKIVLRQPKGKRKNKYYHLCFSYQQSIFFLGGLYSTMLSINTQTNTVCEITSWMEEFERVSKRDAAVMTSADKCIVEDCLWVALQGNNVLLQYNIVTGNYQFWHVGEAQMQYVTVNYDGKYFWLSGNRKVVIKWDKETNITKEIRVFPDKFETNMEESKGLFSCCYTWKNFFYFVPWNSNMLIKLDPKTEDLKCVLRENDFRHFVWELAELNDSELYIEVVDTSGISRYSYVVNAKDEYYNYSILADREEEIKCEMGNLFVLENQSSCLKMFLAKGLAEDNLAGDIFNFGNNIYKLVSEK